MALGREVLPLQVPERRVARRTMLYWALREPLSWGTAYLAVSYIRDAIPDWSALAVRIVDWLPAIVLWLDRLRTTLLCAGAVMVLVSPPVRYQVHRWQVDPDTVYVRDGLLWIAWRIAPTARIQAVHLRRDPLELLLRLSSVIVSTASSAGPIRVTGLDRDRASVVVRELERLAELTPGEAT